MSATAAPGAHRPARGRRPGPLTGAGTLLRHALRRDRIVLPVWVLVIAVMVVSGPGSLGALYGTAAERASFAESVTANGSLRAMYGPAFGDSVGALTAMRLGVFAALFAGIMSLLLVVRHTRDEEESGRQELVSALVVGRRAPLTAALLTAAVANGALTLLVVAGLWGEGPAGALALGLAIGGSGMVFATVAAVAAQLTESGRLARGLAAGVLGAAFVLRAAGDAGTADGSSVLTWLSPLGWAENLRSFGGERWWVLLLLLAAVLVQTGAAYALAERRDIGMSFLPGRPGPAAGRLGGAGALAWRLHRGNLLGWGAGFLLSGVALGGVVSSADDLVGTNERTRDLIERMGGTTAIGEAFLGTMAGLLSLIAGVYVAAAVLRLHGEEVSGRVEPLLAAPVGRVRWAAGHLAVAFGGGALLLLLGGLGLALGHGRDPGQALAAALVQLPAVWVIGGLATLLTCASPRLAVLSWAVAGGAVLLGWIGPALKVPRAVLNLSPYEHLAKLPGEELRWTPVLLLTLLALALVAAGLTALRRRDLVPS
ncbi:ABC transporter permease [Streptomyces sp. NPDC002454]